MSSPLTPLEKEETVVLSLTEGNFPADFQSTTETTDKDNGGIARSAVRSLLSLCAGYRTDGNAVLLDRVEVAGGKGKGRLLDRSILFMLIAGLLLSTNLLHVRKVSLLGDKRDDINQLSLNLASVREFALQSREAEFLSPRIFTHLHIR